MAKVRLGDANNPEMYSKLSCGNVASISDAGHKTSWVSGQLAAAVD